MKQGGVMVDMTKKSLGVRKYYDFGQNSHVPVITAATRSLANKLIKFLNK